MQLVSKDRQAATVSGVDCCAVVCGGGAGRGCHCDCSLRENSSTSRSSFASISGSISWPRSPSSSSNPSSGKRSDPPTPAPCLLTAVSALHATGPCKERQSTCLGAFAAVLAACAPSTSAVSSPACSSLAAPLLPRFLPFFFFCFALAAASCCPSPPMKLSSSSTERASPYRASKRRA